MAFKVKAVAELNLEFNPNPSHTKVNSVDVIVSSSDAQIDEQFYTENSDLTYAGAVSMVQGFVSGLIACLDIADHLGVWEKDKSLKYALEQINLQKDMDREIYKMGKQDI